MAICFNKIWFRTIFVFWVFSNSSQFGKYRQNYDFAQIWLNRHFYLFLATKWEFKLCHEPITNMELYYCVGTYFLLFIHSCFFILHAYLLYLVLLTCGTCSFLLCYVVHLLCGTCFFFDVLYMDYFVMCIMDTL